MQERAAALATSLRRCGLDACYLRRGGADSLAKLLGRLPAGGSLLAVGPLPGGSRGTIRYLACR